MKDRIIVTKKDNKLHFYMVSENGQYYLFSQGFSKSVYQFFARGISERELLAYRRWNRNPRLDKTVERIPIYTRYVRKEVM